MSLTTEQIYGFYYGSTGDVAATLQAMLVESLSPHQRKIYELVYDSGQHGLTSVDIANKLKASVRSIDNALMVMFRFDLIVRSRHRDSRGIYYRYYMGNSFHK